MMSSKTSNTSGGIGALWQQFRREPRYWTVLLIAVLIVLFGRASTPVMVQYPGGYSNPLWTAERVLNVGQDEQRFSDALSSATGDYWKIFLTMRSDISEPDRSGIPNPTEESVGVWLRSPNGTEQLVGNLDVPVMKDFSTYELTVQTQTNYRDLIVRRLDESSRALLLMDKPQLVRLNVSTEAELAQLKPTVVGSTRVSIVDQEIAPKNEAALQMIGVTGELVGQIFKPEEALLSGVGVKLLRSGNGGLGTYRLGIYEVNRQGGEISVSEKPISSLDFTAEGAFDYYAEQPGGYAIHFPIVASLEVGKEYLAAFSEVDLRVGTLNNLSLVGESLTLTDSEMPAVKLVDGQSVLIGQVWLQTYTVDVGGSLGRDWPAGTRVIDLGRGEGFYLYQKNNSLAGAFNLHNIGEVANAVSANLLTVPTNVPQGRELIYKLDTIYPFRSMHLRTLPYVMGGSGLKLVMYYSFDQVTWLPLGDDSSSGPDSMIEQTIEGDGAKHVVYIKAVGEAKKMIKDAWFGIGEMQVTAGINIQ